MTPTRRDFVTLAATVGIAVRGFGRRSSFAPFAGGRDAYPRAGDPLLKTLAAAALDAAKAAGASYADVRFTLTRQEFINLNGPSSDEEHAGVGVRVLANGAWGFAASPLWTTDEVARLAREAAGMAKANAQGRSQKIDLGPPPPVASGTWTTPIKRDPFTVPIVEKLEVMQAYGDIPGRLSVNATPGADVNIWSMEVIHRRQEKTFASSDGAFTTQTLYTASPAFALVATAKVMVVRSSDLLQPRAGGWEVVSEASLEDEIPIIADEALAMARDGFSPVQPDRYDVLMNGMMVGAALARSLGIAAELDRVLGHEANAGGTSYLAPPADLLGTYALGPSLLTVYGDRSRPDGLASVRWDDDGVAPDRYAIVKDGILVDYHTTREFASTLAPWYTKASRPAISHGCAASEHAIKLPLVQPPNLEMIPNPAGASFDALVAGIEKGLVIKGNMATFDRQQLNGDIDGTVVYEVRNGKRTAFLRGTECLIRAPEFWKSLQAVGNASTQMWAPTRTRKGQPTQSQLFSVGAPAALFKKVVVTDRARKA